MARRKNKIEDSLESKENIDEFLDKSQEELLKENKLTHELFESQNFEHLNVLPAKGEDYDNNIFNNSDYINNTDVDNDSPTLNNSLESVRRELHQWISDVSKLRDVLEIDPNINVALDLAISNLKKSIISYIEILNKE